MTNNTTVELGANPRVPGSATLINLVANYERIKLIPDEYAVVTPHTFLVFYEVA